MSTLDRGSSIAEIVLEHSECAKVFGDHGIDFCCRGERSLATACAERGIDVDSVVAELERAISGRKESAGADPRAMSTPELVSFIRSRHHAYTYDALRFLEPLAAKVARVHGEHNPKLLALRETFGDLAAALEPHMREEEDLLFPSLTAKSPDDGVISAELSSMLEDHLRVGTLLSRIRALADDFNPPEWACGSYRTLMKELAALEMETLRHVHLENHVLMPRFAASRTTA